MRDPNVISEAVDAVGGLVDTVKAAGAFPCAVVGPQGPRDDRRHLDVDVDFSGAGEVDM